MNKMSIAFEIPDRWVALVDSGEVVRRGAILFKKATGAVVGHVQETGGLEGANIDPVSFLISAGRAAAGDPSAAASLIGTGVRAASAIAANVQLRGISKQLVRVESLVGATKSIASVGAVLSGGALIASVVGIGVSVAGFKVMNDRLNALDTTLSKVGDAVRRQDNRLAIDRQSHVSAQMAALDECLFLSNRGPSLDRISGELQTLLHLYRGWVSSAAHNVFLSPDYTLEQAIAEYQRVVQLSLARMQVLLLQNEQRAATNFAEEVSQWHQSLARSLSPVALADARTTGRAAPTVREREQAVAAAQDAIAAVRESSILLAQKPAIIRSIPGPVATFVETLRERRDLPVLVHRLSTSGG